MKAVDRSWLRIDKLKRYRYIQIDKVTYLSRKRVLVKGYCCCDGREFDHENYYTIYVDHVHDSWVVDLKESYNLAGD